MWLVSLVVVVSLLAPRVSVHVVSVCLPEAGRVFVAEAQSPDPLGGFPEIEMGHEQPHRSAVCGFKRFAVEGVCEHCLSIDDVFGWDVRGVSAVAPCHDVVAGRFVNAGSCEEVVYGYSAPIRVELRPLGDAVDVGMQVGLGQLVEFLPVPFADGLTLMLDGEVPGLNIDFRGWTG